MRSRIFSFGFLLICITAMFLGVIVAGCTAAQKAQAQSVVAATTQPTTDAINVVSSLPIPFADYAKTALLLALGVETIAGYVIKNLPNKADPKPAVASGATKPQVLPS